MANVPGAHRGVGSGRITSGNLSGNILTMDWSPSSHVWILFDVTLTVTGILP